MWIFSCRHVSGDVRHHWSFICAYKVYIELLLVSSPYFLPTKIYKPSTCPSGIILLLPFICIDIFIYTNSDGFPSHFIILADYSCLVWLTITVTKASYGTCNSDLNLKGVFLLLTFVHCQIIKMWGFRSST
ncbi:hypothetical protein GDO81_015208 [Engystomops pustulosus]|uniref:Uncharacterized protein n=1 Tax=Engystomops pustulosus TaxID=76066 RepID=A0AAV7ALV1_ENGPU|nr:hypothetical protein GDO81_015208 [Engystomops pustulosus]